MFLIGHQGPSYHSSSSGSYEDPQVLILTNVTSSFDGLEAVVRAPLVSTMIPAPMDLLLSNGFNLCIETLYLNPSMKRSRLKT